MRETWRWFGSDDPISIAQIRQTGASGIVSALHEIPTGEIWPSEAIAEHKRRIGCFADGRPTELTWDVVESLPVSENIKLRDGDWSKHVDNYVKSIRNLAENGVKVVCYNFMPVLDWTRTELNYSTGSGARAMRFDEVEFAVFDIHLLGRCDAADDYRENIVIEAEIRYNEMSKKGKDKLVCNVIAGLPGAEASYSMPQLKEQLARYNGMSADDLRSNMRAFLETVVPVAQDLGVRLCCHPDDPPFPLLGLPRIMSTEDDYGWLCSAVDSHTNGITLCAGSLGAGENIDLSRMMRNLGSRVHFLHLRDTSKEAPGRSRSFHESDHLSGDSNIPALINEVLNEEERRRSSGREDASIPFRPDHGQEILTDLKTKGRPGYPLVGRTKGLAELRGVIAGLQFMRMQEKRAN